MCSFLEGQDLLAVKDSELTNYLLLFEEQTQQGAMQKSFEWRHGGVMHHDMTFINQGQGALAVCSI